MEWVVECGGDDPVVVVPWASEDDPEGCAFVDLRENPYDMDRVAEAEMHPALMQALRSLNAGRSPVFTVKCDAWAMDAEELEGVAGELDVVGGEAAAGFVSYVDVIWRERALFVSFHQQEQRLMRLQRLLEPVDAAYAMVECVLRAALVDLTGPQEGFATSVYVKAVGTDAAHAYEEWGKALAGVVGMLRGKEFVAG